MIVSVCALACVGACLLHVFCPPAVTISLHLPTCLPMQNIIHYYESVLEVSVLYSAIPYPALKLIIVMDTMISDG